MSDPLARGAPAPATLDRRLRPTAGVLLLFGEAAQDLVLLLPRLLLALLTGRKQRRRVAELVRAKARHAP